MKIFIMNLFLALMFLNCVMAQDSNQEIRQLDSFVEVKVAESIKATLIKGSTNEVKVITRDVELDKVLTEIVSGRLYVHMKKGDYFNNNIEVVITYVEELSEIRVSSSASIESKGSIITEELYIKASSSGKIVLPLNVQQLKVDVSSSGKAKLNGTAETIVAEASSAGNIKAYELKCKGAKVDASSSGKIEISVSKEVIGQASSSGKVSYIGDPDKVLVETSSSGSIKKG